MARILVVDDETNVRAILRKVLEREDYTVFEAPDGQVALDGLAAEPVDLIITDIEMPNANGYDLLHQIKQTSPETPVIIMTGKPTVSAAVLCFKTGATDFLTKPIDFAKLSDLIGATLERAEKGANPEATLPGAGRLRSIAGYHVARTLGVGNYGMVFLGIKPGDPQATQYAVKILKINDMGGTPDEEAVTRFMREAEAASRIEHPNIVKIFDYGWAKEEEIPYMVMEYVKGKSLKAHITQGTDWTYEQKARLLRQIAAALVAIHSKGVYHRDVKPQNVIVTEELEAKLTDFGIVKLPDSELTQNKGAIGTPAYMAPEAFALAEPDERTDIFSLGVLAYELFLSTMPFAADTVPQVALQVKQKRPVEPRKIDLDMPRALQDILARMLKKSPSDRYQSAAMVVEDFDHFLAGEAEPKPGIFELLKTDILIRDWD